MDYAGTISDQTAPNPPSVFAGARSGDPSWVDGSWSASDPDSAITAYRHAIGSAPGAADIVSGKSYCGFSSDWTDTGGTSVSRSGLGLVDGRQYWLAVRARNAGGLWSTGSYSAFTAGQVTPRGVYLPFVRRG